MRMNCDRDIPSFIVLSFRTCVQVIIIGNKLKLIHGQVTVSYVIWNIGLYFHFRQRF